GNPIGIDRIVVQPLGFEKNLVTVARGEPYHLVLDRGAVARADALDLPRIDRRAVKIGADDGMGGIGRAGDVTDRLRRRDCLGQEGKRRWRVIAALNIESAAIDCPPVEAWRRAGLQPAEAKAEPGEAFGEADRRLFADTA